MSSDTDRAPGVSSSGDDGRAEGIAQDLMGQHGRGAQFAPLDARAGVATIADAYAVQRAFVGLKRAARGSRPAGFKIGLTSQRMQAMCGIDSPIAGVILQDEVHASGATLLCSAYGRLGIEFEIAVRLGRDLGTRGTSVDSAEIADAVNAVCPAIEIVDDRHCDYKTLDVLSLVADNSWNAGVVLGPFQNTWGDLAALEGVVTVDGQVVDRGFGRDVLGSPFVPLAWLANALGLVGGRLRAGDIVMTGSMVTTRFPIQSCEVEFDVGSLGRVALSVEADRR